MSLLYLFMIPVLKERIPSIPLTPVVYDAQTQDTVTIPLYVYTVAVKTVPGESNNRELCPQVKEFLYRIGCDTTQKITYTQGEVVKM